MTNMAAMPIYGKNLLLWNLKTDDLENLYMYVASSSTKYVQMMTLDWPWPILWQVKFGPLCFCMGKS